MSARLAVVLLAFFCSWSAVAAPDATTSGPAAALHSSPLVAPPHKKHRLDDDDSRVISIVLMAHRRVDSVEKLLDQLAEQEKEYGTSISLVLAHSVDDHDTKSIVAIQSLLARFRRRVRGNVRYLAAPVLRHDTSFSTNAAAFGSKRKALINLISGLDAAFQVDSDASFCVVLEDDAVLSRDALAFFLFAKRSFLQRRRSYRVDFATALTQLRPSLLVGMRDAELVSDLRAMWWQQRPSNHSSAASSLSASAADALLDDGRPAQQYSATDGTDVDVLMATPRTVFTTRAWALTRRAYLVKLRPLLEPMSRFVPALLSQGAGSAGTSTQWRSGHSELSRCLWCSDYCYDHAIEWLLQGHRFLSPVVPRVTQRGDPGMSSEAPATNDIFTGPPTQPQSFRFVMLAGVILRFFPGLGMSAIAPRRPTAGWGGLATAPVGGNITTSSNSTTSSRSAEGGGYSDGGASVVDFIAVLAQEPVIHLAMVFLCVGLVALSALCEWRCCCCCVGVRGGRGRQKVA